MTLGLAIIIVFVLYLIDKHNRWRQAVKAIIGLVVLAVLGIGGYLGWQKYDEYRTEKQAEAEAVAAKPFSDCMSRNSQFSNAEEECKKNPTVVLQAAQPTLLFDPSASSQSASPASKSKIRSVLGSAVVSPSFGENAEIYNRCNFDAVGNISEIEACHFGNTSVAAVHKGDRVQLLSRKVRSPSGDEIYEVKFEQWSGWMDSGDLSVDLSAQ